MCYEKLGNLVDGVGLFERNEVYKMSKSIDYKHDLILVIGEGWGVEKVDC